jgi:aspartate/methionine/tyrosine aminotransferase
MESPTISAFRPVPRTGVIYVNTEAAARGFHRGHSDWCNLGQGQPETGSLEGAPPRAEAVSIHPDDQEYAPVAGLWELREAVAHLYNIRFRDGKASKYTADNVAICPGGRAALTRACTALGRINLGHFLPDYTAYEELLDTFRRFNPIPILLERDRGYAFSADELAREIEGRGLGALLLSNPCNPTGRTIQGDDLAAWIDTARRLDCAVLSDEFYGSYVWQGVEEGESVSAARYVEDVNEDPVVVFNGLTKNWRYPGWRVSWAVGPEAVISSVTSAGSFLDGGGSRPLQRAAVELLEPERVRLEMIALQRCFKAKRTMMLDRLKALGVRFDREPEGSFYAWGDVGALPESLNSGMRFFRAALDQQVIVVPGEFFDVNPGKRRKGRHGRFENHVRFSFGPEESVLEEGLSRLERMVQAACR